MDSRVDKKSIPALSLDQRISYATAIDFISSAITTVVRAGVDEITRDIVPMLSDAQKALSAKTMPSSGRRTITL